MTPEELAAALTGLSRPTHAPEEWLFMNAPSVLRDAAALLLEQQATITELAHLRDNVHPDTLQELDNANSALAEARATIDRLTAERDGAIAHLGYWMGEVQAESKLADDLATDLRKCWTFARDFAHAGQLPPPSLEAYDAARSSTPTPTDTEDGQ